MLTQIRPGVSFNLPAAVSFMRIEHQLGRELSTNRTTVPYVVQRILYDEWKAGLHPEIPIVLDPADSVHVYRDGDVSSATAVDSDERGDFWDDNGWKLTNNRELWHREYQWWNDNHINDATPTEVALMKTIEILSGPAWEAAGKRVVTNGSATMEIPAGHAQMLINKGSSFTLFDTNDDLIFTFRTISQLDGMDDAAITERLDKLTANVKL